MENCKMLDRLVVLSASIGTLPNAALIIMVKNTATAVPIAPAPAANAPVLFLSLVRPINSTSGVKSPIHAAWRISPSVKLSGFCNDGKILARSNPVSITITASTVRHATISGTSNSLSRHSARSVCTPTAAKNTNSTIVMSDTLNPLSTLLP